MRNAQNLRIRSSGAILPGTRGCAGRVEILVSWLRSTADVSEPVVLTLSQLRRWPVPAHPNQSPVFVIENPSLLMEAASRSWDGPVLVCSSGRPTVAAVTLLRQLAADGAVLYQHADFDPGGLSITTWLAARVGTVPWKMTGAEYSAAVAHGRDRVPLAGRIPDTPWDSSLHRAMAEAAEAVYEEELRNRLLDAMLSQR